MRLASRDFTPSPTEWVMVGSDPYRNVSKEYMDRCIVWEVLTPRAFLVVNFLPRNCAQNGEGYGGSYANPVGKVEKPMPVQTCERIFDVQL